MWGEENPLTESGVKPHRGGEKKPHSGRDRSHRGDRETTQRWRDGLLQGREKKSQIYMNLCA